MNIEEIKALAEVFTENKLTALEISEGDLKIKIKKSVGTTQFVSSETTTVPILQNTVQDTFAAEDTALNSFDDLTEVPSPIVGIFYSAPSPDAEPFVSIGSKVKKGDVICIIEAMKLMNEIKAEQDGEIVDICIKNGDIAEFGQTIFKMV